MAEVCVCGYVHACMCVFILHVHACMCVFILHVLGDLTCINTLNACMYNTVPLLYTCVANFVA